MPPKFEIVLKVNKEINTDTDLMIMEESISLINDACDCGAKGILLCQMFSAPDSEHILIEGAFINSDLAAQVLKIVNPK